MKILRILLVIGLLQNTHAQDLSGDTEKGEQLYYNFACYSCHGYNATMRVPLVGDASGIMSSEQDFLPTFDYVQIRTRPIRRMPCRIMLRAH